MKVVAILEVMWDWRNVTTDAGYRERAPRWFTINRCNFTGRRLYSWMGPDDTLQVTNACPQLVTSAKGRGIPDKIWLSENLERLQPFDLLLVCGKVAQATYSRESAEAAAVIELPHPAARCWTRAGLVLAKETIRQWKSGRIILKNKVFTVEPL